MKLRVLDLFSGIGGFSLGLERTGGFETVAFCEIEEFPRKVLAKNWPDVQIYDDVKKLRGADIDGPIDVICGGYPCQPFSAAGKRRGKADDRHLWPEFSRLVDEFRPAWVIGENVAGHISMGLDDVLADLEAKDYTCRTFVIPACAVGASHRRDRVWTVAHSELQHGEPSESKRPGVWSEATGRGAHVDARGTGDGSEVVADTAQLQRNGGEYNGSTGIGQVSEFGAGSCQNNSDINRKTIGGTQSRLGRVADGFSCWLDEPRERVKVGVKDRAYRLKALGNAVHPDIPMMIGHAILEAINETRNPTKERR